MHPVAKGFALAVGVFTAAALSMPAHADVFRCTVDGRTVYQDKPCAGGADEKPRQRTARSETAGGIAVPKAFDRMPTPGASSLATLHRDMQDAETHRRHVQTAYDADVRLTRARVAGMPLDQQDREAEALKAKWLPQIQQANQRTDDLRDQLRRECPGGASLSASRQECRK